MVSDSDSEQTGQIYDEYDCLYDCGEWSSYTELIQYTDRLVFLAARGTYAKHPP